MLYFLSDHWLALLLLLIATGLLVRASYKSLSLRSGWIALPASVAVGHFIYRFGCPSAESREELLFWWGSVSLGLAILQILLLLAANRWSHPAFAIAMLTVAAATGYFVAPLQIALKDAYLNLLGVRFVQPYWLLLILALGWIIPGSIRRLSGLGSRRRYFAIAVRSALLIFLALALAEPQLRKPNENTTVLFLLDRSLSIPTELDGKTVDSSGIVQDSRWRRIQQFVNDSVAKRGPAHRNDLVGAILFGKRPRLAMPPGNVDKLFVTDNLAGPIDGQYTDIASAIKLALASFPEGSAKRIVLVSDGNENIGNAEEQALLAKQNGVQIDTLLLAPDYRNDNEVMVQSIETPSRTAKGARLPLRVLMRNTNPNQSVEGTLELIQVREGREKPIPIQPSFDVLETTPQAAKVRLRPGLTVFTFRDKLDEDGKETDVAYSYKALFKPREELVGDRIQNNRAITHVIARGKRQVLVLEADGDEDGSYAHQNLIDQLRAARFKVLPVNVGRLPQDRNELAVFLSNYDCVVMTNVPAELLTKEQQETIRSNTYDQGCGLVVVGGPDSYGAGGYQKTPIEDALPVDCDIKAMKAAGKGGLVLIMHASELADGNKWQKEIAKLAIQKLAAVDMVGMLYFGGLKSSWHIPFQTVGGDRSRFFSLIDKMIPGDMPDFDPHLKNAYEKLSDPDFGLTTKHCIIISDGDPPLGPLGTQALAGMAKAGITCTTVGVATHGMNENKRMELIANSAAKGGKFYEVKDANKLLAIYIQETRRVSQSFLYDARFTPQLIQRGGPTEQLDGKLPELYGFIRTTLKPSPLAEMLIEGPKVFEQRFPILAAWQYGLGRSVAFTSDARSLPPKIEGWDRKWAASDMYRKFWEQVVGWAIRGVETDRLTSSAEYRDGKIRWVVEARDDANQPITNLRLEGGITQPNGGDAKPIDVRFEQKAPGLYEAELKAEEAGTYLLNTVARQATATYKGRIKDGLSTRLTEKEGKLFLDDGTEVRRKSDGGIVYGDDGTPVVEQKGIDKIVDSQRSAVTISYSPEFNDLESNPALMTKLSKITGGNVYTEDESVLKKIVADSSLFRPGLPSSRSLQTVWPWLVFLAGALLLVDVGLRRVHIDYAELDEFASAAWSRLRRSRHARSAGDDDFLSRLRQKKVEVAESINTAHTSKKFEASADPSIAYAPPPGADSLLESPSKPIFRKPEPKPDETAGDKADDFFGKLKKAKKRADIDRPNEEQTR